MIMKRDSEHDALPDREWFQDLIKRANDGDTQAKQDLRQTMEENPQLATVAGDLGLHAMDQLIRSIAGEDVALQQAIEHEAELLLDDLAGNNPTRHRRMLATHVVCCWLQVRHFDLISPPVSDTGSARFRRWQREANHRYTLAVKLLHDLEKMEQRTKSRKRKS